MRARLLTAGVAAALLLAGAGLARENVVRNGSMELGPGLGGPDPRVPANWTLFGPTAERSSEEASGGSWSLKIFGSDTTVGAFQDVAVSPGDSVTISAMLYTRSGDRISGDAEAKIKLEFFDAADNPVGTPTEITVLDATSPADTWTPASIGPLTAPAGAAKARMVCVWTYTNASFGSAYWDECSLTVNGGANLLLNPGFEEAGSGTGFNPFGIDFWIGFGGQQKSSDVAFDGTYSVDVIVNDQAGSFSGLFQDTVALEAGDRIFAHAWVYNPSTGGLTGSAAAAIKLEFFPASDVNVPPPEELLSFDANDPVETWVPVTYTTTVPAGITLARIVLVSNDTDPNNGPVYFDLASAERGTQPGVNQLLNASFEQGTSGPNGLDHWTEFRGIGCAARKNAFEVPAFDGFSVLKISGDCVAGVYQDIEVTPGETLTISAWLRSRADMPYASANAQAGVKVEWRAGSVPPQVDIGGAPNNTVFAGAPTDTWIPIWIDYTMPAGSAALVRTTVIVARGDAPDAHVYFDGFEGVVTTRFDGADSDADGDEDLHDFAQLQRCFGGVPLDGYNCFVFDQNEDNTIDTADSGFFFPRMTGPN